MAFPHCPPTVVDWLRRQRPGGVTREIPAGGDGLAARGEPLLAPYAAEPGAALLEAELLAQLQQGLATLSEREREALALRFTADLRAAEVGEILGLAEGATKMLIYRAILKLKGVIARDSQGV